MQAQGNDYIYFDFLNEPLPDLDFNKLSLNLSRRHTGIGSDGIVLLLPDQKSDAYMRIFNADGTEAKSCGSALRCVTSYLSGKSNKRNFSINSLSGVKFGEILNHGMIKVNLGTPVLIKNNYQIGSLNGNLIDLGNQHFVVTSDILPAVTELEKFYLLCQNDNFTRYSNLEFVKINNPHEIETLIWERGSGATLACGTGAGASVYSGLESGLLESPVNVKMPGGCVNIEFHDHRIFLIGAVDFVFAGELSI